MRVEKFEATSSSFGWWIGFEFLHSLVRNFYRVTDYAMVAGWKEFEICEPLILLVTP